MFVEKLKSICKEAKRRCQILLKRLEDEFEYFDTEHELKEFEKKVISVHGWNVFFDQFFEIRSMWGLVCLHYISVRRKSCL